MIKKGFDSILDELDEMFKKEGHSYHIAAMVDGRVDFGIPPIKRFRSGPSDPIMEKLNETPVAGKNQKQSGRNYPEEDLPEGVIRQKSDKQRQLKLPPSSTIQSAVYWPTKEYLLVSFKSGSTYSYTGVPMQTVQLWQQASSAGSWFYYNIRTSYQYQKMG